MSEKKWITVAEAALLGNCSRATVYRILKDQKNQVRTVTGPDKAQRVHALDFLHAQAKRKPGRPKGTPSRNGRAFSIPGDRS